jgi:peptidoglycan/xylan/chitin deacetylase (PgdA/CDA1 family)
MAQLASVGLAVAEGGIRPDLKQGALVMTFDDMHAEQWLAAAPVFTQNAARVTFFVSHANQLSKSQVSALQKLHSQGHAIACHSVKHEKAVDYVKVHGVEAYLKNEIDPANAALKGYGFTPTAFAYPSSQNNAETDAALLTRFRHMRTGGVPTAPGQELKDVDLFFVPAAQIAKTGCIVGAGVDYLGEPGKRPVQEVLNALDRARKNGEIIVLYAHNINAKGPGHHLDPAVLNQILAHAKSIGLPAISYDDLP